MLRRWIAVVLLTLTAAGALAETTPEPLLEAEESAAFVETMFRAAAGVTKDGEWAYREGMTLEQRLARNAECAAYRERTTPWLLAALTPYEADTQPTPEPTAAPKPTAEPEITYTTSDSWAAFFETELGTAFVQRLGELGAQDEETALELSRRVTQEWLTQVDHEKLTEMNEDYLFWLYAPGTQIDYPVVQDEGNDYYLNHLFNKERNAAGTLFADYRNQPQLLDPNTVVYGHHMRNDSMFGTLTDYEDQEYYEANPVMLVFHEEEIALLEVFACYTTDSGDHCYQLAISGEENMNYFVRKAKEKSDVNCAVEVTHEDRIVTLSTCAYDFENARYVVLTRVKSVWKRPKEWTAVTP